MAKIFTFSLIILLVFGGSCLKNREYILNTAKCKIPKLDPFHEEVMKIMKPQTYKSCNKSELLTFVEKNENSASLYIKKNVIPLYTSKKISCCYSYVTRNGSPKDPDVGIDISPCRSFNSSVALTQDIVKVTCNEYNSNNKRARTVYENVHSPITIKESIKPKLKSYTYTSKPFSVLFIVVDSVSRLNFIRTMNRTYRFLKQNDFIEMKGYTKVADNTYPNFVSLLTGLNWDEMEEKCKKETVGGLDECPMIWYDFRKKGYITAYAEDDTPITTFNLGMKGFKSPPTDYYFKPYIEASETLKKVYKNMMPYCTGPESAGERILKLAKDFAITFKKYPTFGIFWMNTFSHIAINAPYGMDEKMKQFFTDMKYKGVFNESFVILLSDHGIRFGDIRLTQNGWLEERMPMNMISVPKRFQDRFEKEYHNLKENGNRLTSTYDMFMTLQDILNLSSISYENEKMSNLGVSLFETIPLNRSCMDANIPPEWCTCMGHFRPFSTHSKQVKILAQMAIGKIKTMHDITCPYMNINLDTILSCRISESISFDKDSRYIIIILNTLPKGTFLVTVKFNQVTNTSSFYIRTYKTVHCIIEFIED